MTKPVSIESGRETFNTPDKLSGRARQDDAPCEQQRAQKKQKNSNADALSTSVPVPEVDSCFVLGYN